MDGTRRLNLFNRELTAYGPEGRIETRTLTSAGEIHDLLTGDFRIEVERGEIERVFGRLPAGGRT